MVEILRFQNWFLFSLVCFGSFNILPYLCNSSNFFAVCLSNLQVNKVDLFLTVFGAGKLAYNRNNSHGCETMAAGMSTNKQ